MREQTRLIFWLLAAMCALRFGLAAFGYLAPETLMPLLGAPPEANPQMPYIVRVWAIRDVVLAVLVLLSSAAALLPLLIGCVVIDLFDVLSALLGHLAGEYGVAHALSLASTAFAALIPEGLALLLILRRRA